MGSPYPSMSQAIRLLVKLKQVDLIDALSHLLLEFLVIYEVNCWRSDPLFHVKRFGKDPMY
jgi:hypothetical protein